MKTIHISEELFERVEAYWGNEFLLVWKRGKQTTLQGDSFQFKNADAHKVHEMIGKVIEKHSKQGGIA